MLALKESILKNLECSKGEKIKDYINNSVGAGV